MISASHLEVLMVVVAVRCVLKTGVEFVFFGLLKQISEPQDVPATKQQTTQTNLLMNRDDV